MIDDKLIQAVEAMLIYNIGAKKRLEPHFDLSRTVDKLSKLPRRGETMLVAHDGSFTMAEVRKWGSGVPYYTCGRFMTSKFPDITGARDRLYPAVLMGIIMARTKGLSLKPITVGHHQHRAGRVPILDVIDALSHVMLTQPKEYQPVMEALWESRGIPRDRVTTTEMFSSWLKEWQEKGDLFLKETPVLLSQREDTGNWGTW